jgi:ornithine carbamoyltransferase
MKLTKPPIPELCSLYRLVPTRSGASCHYLAVSYAGPEGPRSRGSAVTVAPNRLQRSIFRETIRRVRNGRGRLAARFHLRGGWLPGKSDLVSLADMSIDVVPRILSDASRFKREHSWESESMRGRKLALIFEQPSLRTRVSFEVAMLEMGGHALYLHPAEVGLGRRESVADVAKVLSSYVDVVVLRAFAHETLREFAQHSSVPTINGMSNLCHPCQGLTDVFTICELKGARDVSVSYVGDGNAIAHSLMLATAYAGLSLSVACPSGYEPSAEYVKLARTIGAKTGGALKVSTDPIAAVSGADVVYTDVWRSIGQEIEYERRLRIFRGYQVNSELLAHAKPDAIVMHDLPARRGEEITGEVLDGSRSAAYTQAANRLPVQKAILKWLIEDDV